MSGYATSDSGSMSFAMSLDISADVPVAGAGFYYVLRPVDCGTWQTVPGAEPDRDSRDPVSVG